MSQPPSSPPAASRPSLPCSGCGAHLQYEPGTAGLSCPYCGHRQEVGAPTREVREHAFATIVAKPRRPAHELAAHHYDCRNCGAHVQGGALSRVCQFCSAPLVADTTDDPQIVPEAILAFGLDRNAAREALRTWTRSRWFAPNGLKKVADAESMKSTFLPHWTFDSATTSDYKGQRGQYYYVTETYTATVNGKQETRTRQVRKTRWYPARGRVSRRFDDVLVTGIDRGPVDAERLKALEPWPLTSAVAFQPDYLTGHETLRYDVEPESGFAKAKAEMAPVIEQDCRHDIGGDVQRVSHVDTRYDAVTCKLMLLPVWTGSYVYQGKSWQIMVNGCTGEVHGERPYSVTKIVAASLAALILVALVAWLFITYG
ncbi:hypothetical protein ACFO4E_09295 [Nocardiopsis mangrovi]|uniref:Zinc ribbon domain-containing protein n=1 Tax=Nocardiopsis mangrovi TaxID=1179818 RepID=A0ABV9DT43_9ACTN